MKASYALREMSDVSCTASETEGENVREKAGNSMSISGVWRLMTMWLLIDQIEKQRDKPGNGRTDKS